jgi:hypothetical protein
MTDEQDAALEEAAHNAVWPKRIAAFTRWVRSGPRGGRALTQTGRLTRLPTTRNGRPPRCHSPSSDAGRCTGRGAELPRRCRRCR